MYFIISMTSKKIIIGSINYWRGKNGGKKSFTEIA